MNKKFMEELNRKAGAVNDYLDRTVSAQENLQKVVYEAMRYSLLAGGKRIRPVLALTAAQIFGEMEINILPFACAIEMIHTYSLIHDDLPAMDDDDYRRGRYSCHKQFDEATAILAGDALLTKAFELAADGALALKDPVRGVNAIRYIAVCAGTDEAHMLVRREDISAVSQLMDQKVYRQFRKKYEGWDRQENLEFDARVAGRDGRWLRIIVVPDGTDGCDLFIFRDITEDRGRLESPYSL